MRSAAVLRRCAWGLAHRARGAYLLRVARDERAVAFEAWKRADGDATLRLDYPLDLHSVVLDVGGFRGSWAAAIDARYGSRIHIFEPIADYAAAIRERFHGRPSIFVHRYGLGAQDASVLFDKRGDASGDRRRRPAWPERVAIRDVAGVLEELGIGNVDLIKINIEGGEYPLLQRMLATGLVRRCRDLQIQFHEFAENARELRSALRDGLRESHDPTYDYPFVWENWRRRRSPPLQRAAEANCELVEEWTAA